jgi:hypothetical protein
MENGTRKKWAVYTIRRRENVQKAIWVRVGVAFLNQDGSYNLYLDATPLDGKLQMREWKDELQPGAGAVAEAAEAAGRSRISNEAEVASF